MKIVFYLITILNVFVSTHTYGMEQKSHISLAPKIISIFQAIKTECDKLVTLLMQPTPPRPDQLNDIENRLNTQRQILSDTITTQTDGNERTSGVNAYLSNIDGSYKKDNTFKVYAPSK